MAAKSSQISGQYISGADYVVRKCVMWRTVLRMGRV